MGDGGVQVLKGGGGRVEELMRVVGGELSTNESNR